MSDQIRPIREWENVTRERFEKEIAPLREPAVFRGLFRDWPIVAKGRFSSAEVVEYLKRFYTSKPIGTAKAPPAENGRLFYNGAMNGYNFQRTMQDMRLVLSELLELENATDPQTIAMQAVTASDHLPGF
ncbi:MAG TPA: cupin-like domain-containing protein, partial [Sphingomicrobium sp.]